MAFDPSEVRPEHLDALAALLQASPALQKAIGVSESHGARIDVKGKEKPKGTYGVSPAYIPVEFPKALHMSRTEFVVVHSAAEEAEYLAAGYQHSPYDFAPEPEEIDEVAELKRQVALLMQRLAGTSDKELRSRKAD